MTKRAAANGGDRMPGPWKLLGSALGIIGLFITGIFLWLNSAIADAQKANGETRTLLVAESEKRAAGQAKSENTATEIKGKVENLEKDVKRVEQKVDEGLKEITTQQRQNLEKVLDAIEKKGRTR